MALVTTDRNSAESILEDINHLEGMREKAEHLQEFDWATGDHLLQEINDWIEELQEKSDALVGKTS